MSGPELETAAHWLRLALGDLTVARWLLGSADVPARAAAEHAQQAAEKAVKAIIALDGADPPRIHDLVALARLVAVNRAVPGDLTPIVLASLTDAAAARYPDLLDAAYEIDETQSLLAGAAAAVDWARDLVLDAGASPADLTAR